MQRTLKPTDANGVGSPPLGKNQVSAPTPKYQGMVGTTRIILQEEGARALFNGLSAGLQR